jgi:hypothetical protein
MPSCLSSEFDTEPPEAVGALGVAAAPLRRVGGDRDRRDVTGKPVNVYPNSGEEWDAQRRTWVGTSQHSARQAQQWVADGARIVGGCCRVRPADIDNIARAVVGAG